MLQKMKRLVPAKAKEVGQSLSMIYYLNCVWFNASRERHLPTIAHWRVWSIKYI
jgi:hypothetical protein